MENFSCLHRFVQLFTSRCIYCSGNEFARSEKHMKKEKEKEVLRGDVDDLIFQDDWFVSER